MEKNTMWAVILSIIVIVGVFLLQGPRQAAVQPASTPAAGSTAGSAAGTAGVTEASGLTPVQTPPQTNTTQASATPTVIAPAADDVFADGPLAEEWVTIDTDLLTVVLSSAGGDVVSWKLKEHDEDGDDLEMILSGNSEAHAFTVAFGGLNAQPVTSNFYVKRLPDNPYSVEFSREFTLPAGSGSNSEGGRFKLTKRYDFRPNEYMFELTVSLDGGYSVPGFNFPGAAGTPNAAYTLAFGPQIGPKFVKLDQRYEYRQYMTYTNGKRKMMKINDNNPDIISTHPSWAAITGKYFTFIAIPYLPQYDLNFSAKPEPGLSAASRLSIIRPPLNTARADDTYRFYLGPKNQDVLKIYNNGSNSFNLRDTQLIETANSRGFLAPLEKLLKWLLLLFYKVIPNYGVAIIFLTLLVKIAFFPLTKKGSEATLRMQSISPKIKELQDKYKDNPQKMNAEMAELYKKEGYNPLSGCLPMLLQFPIFFAMYNLFNNHFDLRGAMFIPKWIPDLSLPESILNFGGHVIPILGWTDLRLLPFIYVGSQLLYGKVTQTPDQQGNTQMKMMLYAMPIVFFFVLYNVPSGLLIYWIFSNVLTMVQQVAINKYLAPKRAAQSAANAQTKTAIIPPKKKKKK
ncbi:MAG: membrane protein insertase YidC [Treponema sp.]|jgi:YidC/Oxa1 family membrane protein insertase|nr:membrane protein insertase YidC [Treponema sp.]